MANAILLPRSFDMPADFGSLALAGSGLGWAGFTVLDDSSSILQVAQAGARFPYVECSQCSACKYGLGLASGALNTIFNAKKASLDHWERALTAASGTPQGNRCYLPVQGSILIPSLLRSFRAEFESQIANPASGYPGVDAPQDR